MTFHDLLEKCAEVPGACVKEVSGGLELCLNQPQGTGIMRIYQLFPGIVLTYIWVDAFTWAAPDLADCFQTPLLLNYCILGRCELLLDSGNYVFLKENEMALTNHFAQKQYIYPRRMYQGLELFLDANAAGQFPELKEQFGIHLPTLANRYCPEGKTFISACPDKPRELFGRLWGLRDMPGAEAIFQMRIAVLDLLSSLICSKDISETGIRTFLTVSQVKIAMKTEELISADPGRHLPARELAAMFSISETSLKNYFREVYGQNLSAYLQDLRMETAAKLLADTRLPVSEVAMKAGYQNQSKFAAAFKKYFSQTPLEYRRLAHLQEGD